MDRTFTKILFFLLFILLASTRSFAQTISTGTIDTGPYGQGATIAVPISVNDAAGCITPGNVYKLYLSDASGNFSPGTVIGTYSGFYAPFVNGLIPSGTPAGTGYKVKVTASSPSASISVASAAFTIKAVAGVTAGVSSSKAVSPGSDIFLDCYGNPGTTDFPMSNTSSGTTTSFSIYDEIAHAPTTVIDQPLTSAGYTFAASQANYTVTVKSVDGAGTVGTRDYQIINNETRTNLGSAGNGFVCITATTTGDLSYAIDISAGPSGMLPNYPGDTYSFNWGDGSSSTFTYCQLKATNGIVTHTFSLPSCGATGSNNKANQFAVVVTTLSPFGSCSLTPTSTGSAKVLKRGTTKIVSPLVVCNGSAVIITNGSHPGPNPNNTTTATCADDLTTLYDWYLDDHTTPFASGVPLSQNLTIPAGQAAGSHTIWLHQRNAPCGGDEDQLTICFEAPAQPKFTIAPRVCQSLTDAVTPTDLSIVDPSCSSSSATYSWSVTGPTPVGYKNGTNSASKTPDFLFKAPGTYNLQLTITTTGCGPELSPVVSVIVDAAPVATLSPDLTLCGTGQTLTFDATTGSATKTILSGSTTTAPTTYLWEVTGGAYTFAGGTAANSQYPKIQFTEDKTYTVKVTNTNACGPASDTQLITFVEQPTINAGTYLPICPGSTLTLAATASTPNGGYTWVGGAGTFSDIHSLTSTYTPAASEAGTTVTLTLKVKSPAPCADVSTNAAISITPVVHVNSALAEGICSGTKTGYTITADHTPATFTWTAVAISGSPAGFTATGSGSSIDDLLTNSTTGSANAVDEKVKYTITPIYNGCPGPTADLVVTVHPQPTITAAPVLSPICTNTAANIKFTTNVAGTTTYTWTTDVVTGVSGNADQATPIAATSGIQDVLVNTTNTTQTITYHVTPHNGGCDGATVDVSVVVGPAIIADPGHDDEICGVTSYTLHGNTPVVGTGTWTVIQGPTGANILTPNSPTTTVTGLTLGFTYKFRWKVDAPAGCSNFNDVTIQVDKPTIAGTTATGDPNPVCAGQGTGHILLSGSQGTILGWEYSTDNEVTYNPVPSSGGVFSLPFGPLTTGTWYRAIVQNGANCDILRSTSTHIIVVQPPTTSIAGLPDRICGDGTYHLQGNTPTQGTGKWTVSPSAGITFDDDTKPDATASGLTAGANGTDYVFTWKISTGSPCGPSSNSVTISVDPPAVPGSLTSTATTVCYNDPTTQTITLGGNQGGVVNWEYSTDNIHYNPVSATPNTNTTQNFSSLTTPTWYHAIVKNGASCPAVITQPILIDVVTPPTVAVAGNEDRICGDGTYTLHGNTPTVGTGKWTVIPSAGITFDHDDIPNATASGLKAGTNGTDYVFTWTISHLAANGDNPCGDNSNSVTIHADPPAVPGSLTSPLTTVCYNDATNRIITLGGNQGGVVDWEYSTDNIHYNPVSATPNTNTTQTFSGLTVPTWFHAIVKNGTSCPAVITQPILIDVLKPPTVAAAGNEDRICGDGTYHLQGNTPIVGTGKWTVSPSTAGVTFDDDTKPDAIASGLTAGAHGTDYVFTWTITHPAANGDNPCGDNSNSVTIHADPPPSPGSLSAPITTLCAGDATTQTITLTGNQGSVIDWEYSNDNGQHYNPVSTTPNTAITQTFSGLTTSTLYRAIVQNGPACGPATTQPILITVLQKPSVSIPGPNERICASTVYTLQGNTPAIGTGTWTASSTGVSFVDIHDPTTTASGLVAGTTYLFTWTITNKGPNGEEPCSAEQNSVTIIDEVLPVANTSSDATVCYGSNSGIIKVTGLFNTVDHWEYSEDNGTTWQTIGNTTNENAYVDITHTRLYRAMVVIGPKCGPVPSAPTTITVVPAPPNANAGPGREVCGLTSYTLEANDPGAGNSGKWVQVSGPTTVQFLDDTDPHTTVGTLSPGTYEFKWTITATGSTCVSVPGIVKIINDAKPVGGTTNSDAVVCKGQNDGLINLIGSYGLVNWQYSVDGGQNWTSTGNSGLQQSYHNITQDTWYRARLTNGAVCGPQFSTVTKIIVTDPPVTSNPGPSLSICNQTSYTLQGNDPGTGTGKWTLTHGTGVTIIPATDPHGVATGLIPGNTYEFTWTITGASPTTDHPCGVSANAVTITDDLPPLPGNISPDVTVCKGINNGSVSLQNQFGSIVWMSSTDGGNTWSPTGYVTDTQPYAGLTQTTKYKAMLTNGSCGPIPSDIVTVYVSDPPVTADAGTSLSICNQNIYILEGNNPGTGTGKWTTTPGNGVTILHDTDPNATATGLVAGNTYQFTWTITGYSPTADHPCQTSSNTVTITDDLLPVAGTISADATVCKANNNGSISLTNSSGTIVWKSSTDGHTWTPTGYTSQSQPYTGLTQTTYYQATVSNGSCPPALSAIATINVVEPPVTANAGQSLSICAADTYVLQGNAPGTGTGKWTVAQGTGVTILHDTDPNATATGLVAGNTYKFTWTITGYSPTADHPCDPSPSTVTITDDLAPVGGTVSADATVCTGDNHGSIILADSRGTIQWVSSTDGHTWIPTGFTNTVQPYTNLTQTTQYKAILSSGASCTVAYSNAVTITVGQPPVLSNAGTDQAVCNVAEYALQGNNPGTGTGKWTLAQGSAPATFVDATDPHTTAKGLLAGNTYLFTWTTYGVNPDGTVSVCTPSLTTVKITNDRLPVGGTTTGDATVCSGINSGTITLTNQFGTIQWVSSTDNGATWVSTGNSGTTQPYSNLTQTTKYMAILSNGTCGISNSTVTTITIGPAPLPSNPGADDEVCSVSTYKLKAVLPAGATGKWTIESGAGAQFDDLTDPATTVKGLIPGNTYKFTWTVLGTSPCAPIPGTVTIKDDLPANGGVATAVPAVICAGSNSVITLAGQTGNILRWESSTNGTTWQPIYVTGTVQTFSNLQQTTQYRAILIGQGVCGEVPSAPAAVTVNPTTVVSNPGKDDEVCNVKTYTLNANSPLPNTGLWTITGGPSGAKLADPTNPKTTATGLIPGNTYQFTWTITGTAPCGPSSNAVNIKIDQQAIGGTTAGAATVCAGANDALISLTGQFGTIVKWVSSTNNGATWADLPNTAGATGYHYSGLTQTTQYKALLHVDGICGDAYSTITTITVNPQTVIANAGQNFNICNTNIAKLNGNNPAPFTGMWLQTAGPKVNIDEPASYQTVVRGLAKGNVYTFKWTITGLAPCGNTDASVTIGAYEDVTPSFTQTQSQSCGPVNVTFTNTSTPSPAGTFEWDFGDGTPIVTAINPPTHSFAPSPNGNEITYTVRLTPVSNCGVQTPYVGTVKVSPAKPIASLLPTQISYCGTFSLSAKNMSPGNNAQYDFYLKDSKGTIVQHVRLNDTSTAVFQPITPTASTYYTVYVVATDQCGNQGTSSAINVAVAPSSLVSGIQIKGNLENICLGSPITFQNISTGGDRFTITVYDNAQKAILRMPAGTGDQNYTPTAIGTYYVSITAGNTGCGDAPSSALTPFTVYPAPTPAFTYNADNNYNMSFYNNTADITGIPAPSLNYVWDFGDGSERETTYTPKLHHYDASKSPFSVTLTATTPGTECFNVMTKTIEIKFHGDLYVPNAFIPASQNRELNTYMVKGSGMKTWHMQIFNNFGQLIWESTKLDANGSPSEGWDGTYKGQIVQQGVYIWQISATLLNGEEWKGMSYNGSTPSKTGPIHLIR